MSTTTRRRTEQPNPLRVGLRMGGATVPAAFVIYGASGDLAQRKLLPAIYNLGVRGLLPARFAVVGYARTEMSDDEYRKFAKAAIEAHSRTPIDEDYWPAFASMIRYHAGGFDDDSHFHRLADLLETVDAEHGTEGNRVYYLSKETVQNIFAFRFANAIFEPIWNHRYVDHVQITVAESIGVEHRAAFYEETGVVRDIVQNHLLQTLALVAMEPPAAFDPDSVRDEKTKLLRAIRPMSFENSVRGQYGGGYVAGEQAVPYTSEPQVPPDSTTPTFIASKLEIDNWRWAGTPIYLRAGKRLAKRVTEVAVQFRRPPHLPFPVDAAEHLEPNSLVLRIQPDEGISLRFGAKAPTPTLSIRTVNMDFLYGASFLSDVPEAYETLILDAIRGDGTLFTRQDGVERAWELCDPLLEQWRSGQPQIYPAGSWGPDAADDLLARDGRRWRRP